MAVEFNNRVGSVGQARPVERGVEGAAVQGGEGPDSYVSGVNAYTQYVAGPGGGIGAAKYLGRGYDPQGIALCRTISTLNTAGCESERPSIVAALERLMVS